MKRWWIVSAVVLALILTACGGGPTPQNGTWDQSNWDSANWQ